MALALFDLDNTLLADDSDFLWGCFLVDNGLVDKATYDAANQRFYDEYKQGTLDIFEFLAFSLKPLSQFPPEKLAALHQAFMKKHILPAMTEKGLAQVKKHYTGKVAGTPCFQEGKITRLKQWLENKPYELDNSTFYSDSHNDLSLLEIVTTPIAVDPDDELRATAQKRNWQICSFR